MADSIQAIPSEIQENRIVGQFYGIGLNLTYDTRDNINNPLTGNYIQFRNLNHRKWLGGDFEFSNIFLDTRKYLNTYKKQVLALRFATAFTFSDDVVPFMGYQRLGGGKTMRGYYDGTFLDRNMMTFDVEYRLPLFQDDAAPIWKIWKHLGVTTFASAGQVFGEQSDFALSAFHYSAGGGLRIMLSKTQRSNIRIDYGLGFTEDSGGIGQRQTGLYISVNEVF